MTSKFDAILDSIETAITKIESTDDELDIDEYLEDLKDSLKKQKPIKQCNDTISNLYKSISIVSKTHANIVSE